MTAIKDARTKSGLTQKQVSELAHVPLGTLRRWEQGVNEPPIESIIQLADLYSVSVDELIGSKFVPSDNATITTDERRLIELYRACAPKGHEYLLQVAEVTAGLFPRER